MIAPSRGIGSPGCVDYSRAQTHKLNKHLEASMKTCPDCNGDGVIEKGTDDEQRCPTCGGSGFVPDDGDDNEEVIRTHS